MAAIGLIFRRTHRAHYEDKVAADPRIDALRAKMVVTEDKQFSRDHLDPEKRSIANASSLFPRRHEHAAHPSPLPIGHRRRRKEGIPLLRQRPRRPLRRTTARRDMKNSIQSLRIVLNWKRWSSMFSGMIVS